MGVRFFSSVLLLWVVICVCVFEIVPVNAQKGYTICDVQGCNCTVKTNPWKTANCNLDTVQDVYLVPNGVNIEIVEIFINGGQLIEFPSKTFNSLPGLTLVHINGTKKIVMETKSFYNLTSSSLLIQIQNCDQLIIKTGAFDNMQGSVAAEIISTDYVSIENSAFNKLTMSLFKNIQQLILAKGTFEFKGHGNTKRHGPFTQITFDNVIIPKIPSDVFYSSLADITFRNSKIDLIESKAFRASEIPAVSIINTTIIKLGRGAFTDRTLITTFKISKSNIAKLETEAIMAGISNLIVKHSTLTDIETRAIVSTVAYAEIIGNYIVNFRTSSFIFNYWNTIKIEENIIKNLYTNFIEAPVNDNLGIEIHFIFKGNEIHNTQKGALNFVPELEDKVLIFDDNLFNQLCQCSIENWLEEITNKSKNIEYLMNTSFCTVNKLLSQCFNLSEDAINIKAFTQKVCNNETKCEAYEGKTKVFNNSSPIWMENERETNNNSWLVLIVTVVGLLIIAIIATFIVLLVRGSRWLKRKGYFRNIHYSQNEPSNDDENTIVTIDENEKLEIPDELTQEFLQMLKKKLDNPTTYHEASEMIERLYEMFIVDDSYGNNNRQEDPHVYEELNNLNSQIPPPPYEEEIPPTQNGPRSILKLMEEKINDDFKGSTSKPQLNLDYSEPSDAAVHLYSELKQSITGADNEKKDSLKSNSSNMAFRPLPDKPNNNDLLFDEAGPSSKP